MSQVNMTPIIGLTLEDGWAQVCTNHNQQLTAALAVKGERASNLGRELANQISQSNPQSAQALHHLMLDLLRSVRKSDNQLQLAMSLVVNKKLIVAVFNGRAILKRVKQDQKQIDTILQSQAEPRLIQGRVRANDLLLLLTDQAQQIKSNLSSLLQEQTDLEQISSQLTNQLHKKADSSLSALAMVAIREPSADKKEQTANTTKIAGSDEPSQKSISAELKKLKKTTNEQKMESDKPGGLEQKPPVFEPAQADISLDKAAVAENKTLRIKGLSKPLALLAKALTFGYKIGLKFLLLLVRKAKALFFLPGAILQNLKHKKNKDIYLGQNQQKKWIRIILLILAVISLLVGGFFYWQNQREQKIKKLSEAMQPALELKLQAEEIEETNLIEAREKTEQAINLLSQLKQEKDGDGLAGQIIQKELDSIKDYYQQISSSNQLEQLELAADLRQTEASFIGSEITLDQNSLFILDQDKQQIINLNLNTKQTQITSLEPEVNAGSITVFEDNLYILGEGIYQYSLTTAGEENQAEATNQENEDQNRSRELNALTLIKQQGDSDREAELIASFNTYLYVFNPEKRNIYRYIIRDNDLSEPIGWLTNKQGLDFEQVNSISINGFIWLGNREGAVNKLSQGEPVRFNPDSLDPALTSITDIASHPNLDYIFVLEASQGRIVALSQEGEVWRQFEAPTLAGATQLEVSANGEIYLLNGSLIYYLPTDIPTSEGG